MRPLQQLADAGALFARGDIPAPLTFAHGDELEAVARTFNEMVAARTIAMQEREQRLAEAQAEAREAAPAVAVTIPSLTITIRPSTSRAQSFRNFLLLLPPNSKSLRRWRRRRSTASPIRWSWR